MHKGVAHSGVEVASGVAHGDAKPVCKPDLRSEHNPTISGPARTLRAPSPR